MWKQHSGNHLIKDFHMWLAIAPFSFNSSIQFTNIQYIIHDIQSKLFNCSLLIHSFKYWNVIVDITINNHNQIQLERRKKNYNFNLKISISILFIKSPVNQSKHKSNEISNFKNTKQRTIVYALKIVHWHELYRN